MRHDFLASAEPTDGIKGRLFSDRNEVIPAISTNTLLWMVKFFGLFFFLCSAGVVLGADQESGRPIFRAFTAHDYNEVGQIFAVTEDAQGRMLFGCQNAVLAVA